MGGHLGCQGGAVEVRQCRAGGQAGGVGNWSSRPVTGLALCPTDSVAVGLHTVPSTRGLGRPAGLSVPPAGGAALLPGYQEPAPLPVPGAQLAAGQWPGPWRHLPTSRTLRQPARRVPTNPRHPPRPQPSATHRQWCQGAAAAPGQ